MGSETNPGEVREGFWRMQKPKLRSCQAKKGEKEHRQSIRKMLPYRQRKKHAQRKELKRGLWELSSAM